MGDPAGIGGELTLRAWLALRGGGLSFVALDDPVRLECLARAMGLAVPIRVGRQCRGRGAGVCRRRCRFCRCILMRRRCRAAPIRRTPRRSSVRSNRPRGWRWTGEAAGGRHQPDQQGGALPGRLCLSGPHRVPRRPDRGERPADHDAGQPDAAGCPGDGACLVARLDRHADDGDDRRGIPHHGQGAAAGFRHRLAAAGDRRAESACRRARRAGQRGSHPDPAGDRAAEADGIRRLRPLAAGYDVHRQGALPATTRRSACITIRR